MKLEDLKEAVAELMNEIDYNQLALDRAAREMDMKDRDWWSQRSKPERDVLKWAIAKIPKAKEKGLSFTMLVQLGARDLGLETGGWPNRAAAWDGDIKFNTQDAIDWACTVAKNGLEGAFGNMVIKPVGECPASWGAKETSMGGGGAAGSEKWMRSLSRKEQQVLTTLRSKVLNREIAVGTDIVDSLNKVASELGISPSELPFLRDPDKIKDYLSNTLPAGTLEEDKKRKKRGFGEGEPPDEEIYKKREVVQEIDAETPDAAQSLSDVSKEQGEATKGVADAHTRAAEAAKQRQDASKAWKDAKVTQIKAIDAAEKAAAEEAKATDAQSKAMDAAQKAADAVEKAQAEKEKYLDVAKQAAEAESEAADAAQEAAAAEEEAETEISDASTTAADAITKGAEEEKAFGDAITSDEEARAKEDEEKAKEEDELKKAEEEQDKKDKEAERKAGEEEAKDKAEDAEEEKAAEKEEPVTEVIKSMIREMMAERKWGEAEKAKAAPESKPKDAQISADDLRHMVLQKMREEEADRDKEMIKLLRDILGSLQSIEYHSTPAKGASSQLAQQVGKGWVNEGKNSKIFTNIPSLISEMRKVGLQQEADDHESFFKWALSNPDLTMQEIKNEADAQIADLKAMLRKMSNHVTGDEESLEKQKLRGEVPGHH